jgi:protein O-GlcNAc transferase
LAICHGATEQLEFSGELTVPFARKPLDLAQASNYARQFLEQENPEYAKRIAQYIAANWPASKQSGEILKKARKTIQKENSEYFKNTILRNLIDGKRGDAALALIDAICAFSPPSLPILNFAALALRIVDRNEDALPIFEILVEKAPRNARIANNYGNLLAHFNRYDDARIQYARAIALEPDYASPKFGLGGMLLQLADMERGLSLMRQAVDLLPDDPETLSAYLFSTLHEPSVSIQERLMLAKQYRNALKSPAGISRPKLIKSENSDIRVGFVSGDFRDHPVGYFMSSFLGSLGEFGIDTTLYSNCAATTRTTQDLIRQAKTFRQVHELDDKELHAMIHKDRIQILIDLSGHTYYNRLSLFARRPAAVQATWLGYFATTGVPEIDFIIGDEHVTPKEQQDQFVERIVHIDGGSLCFSQPGPTDQYPIAASASKNGVVFGSFANPRKLTPDVIESWTNILASLPPSRLVLRAKQWQDETLRNMVLRPFQSAGISPDRIEFRGHVARDQYLLGYNEVDIILDTFPYMGGTTTAEALFMGTPVVAKYGDDFGSRIGLSVLKSAGFAEWAAPSTEVYVATALELARATSSGALDKQKIREQALSSRLFDRERFTENFVKCLHAMLDGIRN